MLKFKLVEEKSEEKSTDFGRYQPGDVSTIMYAFMHWALFKFCTKYFFIFAGIIVL
jgi:hypothetical protein